MPLYICTIIIHSSVGGRLGYFCLGYCKQCFFVVSLLLVSWWWWPHRMSLGVFLPIQFLGRVSEEYGVNSSLNVWWNSPVKPSDPRLLLEIFKSQVQFQYLWLVCPYFLFLPGSDCTFLRICPFYWHLFVVFSYDPLYFCSVYCNFSIFIFFPFIFISWRLITLQYCSGSCHILTWISHGFTCIPHPDPSSHLPLHRIPLGLPSAPGPSTCLMHPTWAGDLFHPR